MKTYQDTETGQLHAFDDGVDPFKLNNRNIPTTLSENIIPKPSESHVWLNGDWVKDTEVPKGYKPPVSSVPAYNPAWMAFIYPYTVVLHDIKDKLGVSIEQVTSNSYENSKLSEVVAILPLANAEHINALISYDGAVAIPNNSDYSSSKKAVESINRVLCAILLGGIHVEVINPRELQCGSLIGGNRISSYTPSLHNRLRNNDAAISERLAPLMFPRIIRVSELKDAYRHGLSVIGAINNFSPFFLLHGYTAMVYQNRSDALSSLWIVVEQLTSFLWENRFLDTPEFHPAKMKNRLDSLKQDNRTWSTSVKHELLWQTKFLSENCYAALSTARQSRNKLVHDGFIPDFAVIENLWGALFELFESASGIKWVEMRRLVTRETPESELPKNINFDDWLLLSERFS